MSRRRDVILAVKALVARVLPLATVRGFDVEGDRPRAVPEGGVAVGKVGVAGDPVVLLSPVTYIFDLPFEVELAPGGAGDQAAKLDAMVDALGAAIVADRTLGGRCDWIDASPAEEDDASPDGAPTQRWATVPVVATYSTTSPTG